MIHRNNRMPCIIRTTSSARKVGGNFSLIFRFEFSSERVSMFIGKIYRFRASHMWSLDDVGAIYSAQLKFLSFDSLASAAASQQTSPLLSHIVARDELRRELWAAAGVAKVLGRILVLPRFNCYCDRYWYPILPQCRLPGSQRFKSSQSCPLDQILNVGMLADKEFIVDTRVDGFLEHPDAAPFLQAKRIVQPLVEASGKASCMTPSQLSALFATPETVLHVAEGSKDCSAGFLMIASSPKRLTPQSLRYLITIGAAMRTAQCQSHAILPSRRRLPALLTPDLKLTRKRSGVREKCGD